MMRIKSIAPCQAKCSVFSCSAAKQLNVSAVSKLDREHEIKIYNLRTVL
jgi:hypothetical protein